MFKKKLKAAVRDGVQEVNLDDMTFVEVVSVGAGVGVGTVGGMVLITAKMVAVPPAVVALGKVYAVGGSAMAAFGLGKAFIRGAVGGWKHEMNRAKLAKQD